MKKTNYILAFVISISATFCSYADVKKDYKEAMSTPLFKGSDFPFPELTGKKIISLNGVKKYQDEFSKEDTQK